MFSLLLRFCMVLFFIMPLVTSCGQAPPATNPRPLVDNDGDGYPAKRHGGRDCNDNDKKINPLAKEIIGNKIDENCNGQIDEVTAKEGHWRLTTPKQSKSTWHIEIRTDRDTGMQYVRCLQFSFVLHSTVHKNTRYNMTQWQSHLPPTTIKFQKIGKDTMFTWKYDKKDDTVKTTFVGVVVDTNNDGIGDQLRGTLTLEDRDKDVLAKEVLPFTGVFEDFVKPNETTSHFCDRCYGNPVCPAPEKK